MESKIPKYCIGEIKPYQKGENIFELFRKVAERVPNQIAVIAEDTEYTYAQVFEMAENAAAYFHSKGVQAGDRIALTGYRTVYTIAAIYGLIKLGAAYIPLENDYPTKRVTYILQDSGTDKLIVTSQDFEQEFDGVKEIPFYKGIDSSCPPLPDSIQTIENPCCYIIYTSGTTGAPKGTPICSNDLLNLTFWYADEVELHTNSCVLLLNAFGFDASVKNIFATLLTGCTLLLGSQNLFDIARILKIMQAFQPTVVNCVPRLFHAILEADREHGYHAISSLQYAVLGGERLDKSMIDVLYQDKPNSKLKVLNVYGPTECTSVSTSMKYSLRELSECETVRIGRPIFNKRVYIMDSNENLLPVGEMGELVISGVGIAQHYLHKKANEVFLPDPYYPEDLMYRSGDLGYYDETGNIVFCGRKDKQIKINGHRIELEEIIQTGLKCSGSVWFDVVLCAGERLVGFVKGTEDRSDEIRTAMKEWCMDYMVPAEVISIPEIPLTAHGKTDYEALKEIAETHRKSKKTTVTGGTQAILMEIWEQLLGQNHFGTDEKFFDVGGNSLQLFKMKMLIQEKTGKDVEIVQLLQAATIEAMANLIDHSSSQNKEDKERIRGAVRPDTGVARNKLKERMELLKKRHSGTAQEQAFEFEKKCGD